MSAINHSINFNCTLSTLVIPKHKTQKCFKIRKKKEIKEKTNHNTNYIFDHLNILKVMLQILQNKGQITTIITIISIINYLEILNFRELTALCMCVYIY